MSTVNKVGIIAGSGQVGKAVAVGLNKAGYEVLIGTRDANNEKVQAFLKENPTIHAGSNAEAAKFGDVLLISSGWEGVHESIKQAGPENLKGKVLLDITNPITMVNGRIEILPGVNGGKTIQGWAPESHVVKFLNSVGLANFCFPYSKNEIKPVTFIAGNDATAKTTTTKILNSLGWEHVIDAGSIEAATYVEALCPLWVNASFTHPEFGWSHNWALLTK